MFKIEYLTRQLDLIPVEKLGVKISIVGAGAVGSFTALSLSKMGFNNIEVYDFDTIDNENMNCQFYRTSDIGRKKVDALHDLVYDFTGQQIVAYDKKLGVLDTITADIVIVAVDNMKIRKLLLNNTVCDYFIDPRMSAEYASIEVVRKELTTDITNYLNGWYNDKDAVAERCTAKATMYTVNLLAGQICKVVKDIITEGDYIKSFDWAINANQLVAFNNKNERL
jgi:molybdopterin/thiamine biosynthesis adenylyltransferase